MSCECDGDSNSDDDRKHNRRHINTCSPSKEQTELEKFKLRHKRNKERIKDLERQAKANSNTIHELSDTILKLQTDNIEMQRLQSDQVNSFLTQINEFRLDMQRKEELANQREKKLTDEIISKDIIIEELKTKDQIKTVKEVTYQDKKREIEDRWFQTRRCYEAEHESNTKIEEARYEANMKRVDIEEKRDLDILGKNPEDAPEEGPFNKDSKDCGNHEITCV